VSEIELVIDDLKTMDDSKKISKKGRNNPKQYKKALTSLRLNLLKLFDEFLIRTPYRRYVEPITMAALSTICKDLIFGRSQNMKRILYVQSKSLLFLNNYSNIKALPTDLHNPSNNDSKTRDVENRPYNLQLLSDLKSD
jgi:hypothetical protein